MAPVNSKIVCLLILACLSLTSCAALNLFKGGSGSKGTKSGHGESSPTPDTVAALETKIEQLEDKINSLESQILQQQKLAYTVEYSDPAQLYQKARNLLLENDIDNAADLFLTFAQNHPTHSLADNALYWLGECHYTRGRYAQAIDVFQDLVQRYPRAEKVPDAMLKTGYAYLSLDDVDQASHFLTQVIKKYPFSPAAEKAQNKLSAFK